MFSIKNSDIGPGGEISSMSTLAWHVCCFFYKKDEIKKIIIGPRPGEKIFEELMTKNEAKNAYETDDMLIVLPDVKIKDPDFKRIHKYENSRPCKLTKYSSRDEKTLSKPEITKLLLNSKFKYDD